MDTTERSVLPLTIKEPDLVADKWKPVWIAVRAGFLAGSIVVLLIATVVGIIHFAIPMPWNIALLGMELLLLLPAALPYFVASVKAYRLFLSDADTALSASRAQRRAWAIDENDDGVIDTAEVGKVVTYFRYVFSNRNGAQDVTTQAHAKQAGIHHRKWAAMWELFGNTYVLAGSKRIPLAQRVQKQGGMGWQLNPSVTSLPLPVLERAIEEKLK